MSIANNIEKLKLHVAKLPEKNGRISIVAVTKMVDISKAKQVIDGGIKLLGENRVQEYLNKYEKLSSMASFHLIGHLQTNKIKYLVGKCQLIHSVDSLKLLQEIEKQCAKVQIEQQILIQVNIAKEESKFGIGEDELMAIIKENESNEWVKIKGLMTIAPYEENVEDIRWVFRRLNELYIDIKEKTFYNTDMEFLSMGMSNDYQVAIEEGANMIRIGSKIFV